MTAAPAAAPGYRRESELAAQWAAGVRGPLRLNDGRPLQVIFPGVPGGASGPDFRGAMLDAGGDVLRGDVELHLRASGWRAHQHATDPAYASVVLHVVGEDDCGEPATRHATGRAIPVLVLPVGTAEPGPGFVPPCALTAARVTGAAVGDTLERLSLRRLRMKGARAARIASAGGPAQALYTLLLEQLGGASNRAAFASIARWLPLPVLIERAAAPLPGITHERAIAAELRGAAAALVLRRAGSRPSASPVRRLEQAAACVAHWFPSPASANGWPEVLAPGARLPERISGLGRAVAIEVAANVILPAALASQSWSSAAVEEAWLRLPSPGVYGKLRPLRGWLSHESPAFSSAARLQGGLLLHADYCTRGMCGRCPLS